METQVGLEVLLGFGTMCNIFVQKKEDSNVRCYVMAQLIF